VNKKIASLPLMSNGLLSVVGTPKNSRLSSCTHAKKPAAKARDFSEAEDVTAAEIKTSPRIPQLQHAKSDVGAKVEVPERQTFG
jgi:hypothetical protein